MLVLGFDPDENTVCELLKILIVYVEASQTTQKWDANKQKSYVKTWLDQLGIEQWFPEATGCIPLEKGSLFADKETAEALNLEIPPLPNAAPILKKPVEGSLFKRVWLFGELCLNMQIAFEAWQIVTKASREQADKILHDIGLTSDGALVGYLTETHEQLFPKCEKWIDPRERASMLLVIRALIDIAKTSHSGIPEKHLISTIRDILKGYKTPLTEKTIDKFIKPAVIDETTSK